MSGTTADTIAHYQQPSTDETALELRALDGSSIADILEDYRRSVCANINASVPVSPFD